MLSPARIVGVSLVALIGVVAVLAGAFLLLAWLPVNQAHGFIDDSKFWALKFGTSRTTITADIGQPSTSVTGSEFASPGLLTRGAPPSRVHCDEYTESDAIQDPNQYELCYRNGALVVKGFYEGSGGCVPVYIYPTTKLPTEPYAPPLGC